ncbi:teichuronic acid biosynthesis glycosyltransferase TuaG [Vibrio crassostreae]|uniref:glycosyltransferase family 2 protein n=1 Tax=Vibrio crassostreae TaxID=246167 RepID=UPI000F4A2713|nr:glycosyltransferase family 2 protein [Vibrio crassostreae]ROO66098.1 teichuronic acid biosynthesis glycosyltransferase TuaG [Vibrio crassostreae]ROP03214.1 teichuronic acid biosynthesis glycosyltransferase TuaG [Vibrio crassostreae]ROQ72019.1 teichuronic acid biosynthesis glycosyltransferase TuaG [Vibrio crassostreae]ROR77628.1 teichuronic acid biosynthesis glycosyltransferase TuaG [Vibrio crassostreae]RPE88045.1 teichuronic acid biosynthesis glycosyltransferase TuaG [Vibrio crassostreae]
MKDDLVSIIMPTFNVAHIVADTIQSVVKQTYSNWELIIVDDCSCDSTVSVLSEYADKDSRIRVISNPTNSGAGVSRNNGITISTGQYLAFLDSDDIWLPTKLADQLDFMKQRNAAISHTSFSFIDETGTDRKGIVRVSDSVALKDNLRRTEIGTSTAMIDRKSLDYTIRFSEIRARQDLKLWIDLLSLGYKSYGLDSNLVRYRVREASVSSNKWKMLLVTLKVYWSVKKVSPITRLACYFSYVFNAIKKRNS